MFIESSFGIREEKGIRTFTGIFIALLFPFAAKAIMDITGMPIVAAAIYWLVCGIILRLLIGRRLPYFRPQIGTVWIETIILFVATAGAGYLYFKGLDFNPGAIKFERDYIINIFLFALLNGCFEQLVWMNIYELAGATYKTAGFIFSFIFTGLIHMVFWTGFMPSPGFNNYLFIASQVIIFVVPFIIYIRTKDLTIWSIQHIIYNLFPVLLAGFGVSAFMHIK